MINYDLFLEDLSKITVLYKLKWFLCNGKIRANVSKENTNSSYCPETALRNHGGRPNYYGFEMYDIIWQAADGLASIQDDEAQYIRERMLRTLGLWKV